MKLKNKMKVGRKFQDEQKISSNRKHNLGQNIICTKITFHLLIHFSSFHEQLPKQFILSCYNFLCFTSFLPISPIKVSYYLSPYYPLVLLSSFHTKHILSSLINNIISEKKYIILPWILYSSKESLRKRNIQRFCELFSDSVKWY